MSIDIDYNNRQLIPRLVSTRTSNILSLNMGSSSGNPFKINESEKHNLANLKEEWKQEKTTILAFQILIYGIIHEDIEIDPGVLSYLTALKPELNLIEKDIFALALIKTRSKIPDDYCCDDPVEIRKIIGELKRAQKRNLINPFSWCDIGYYYTILGQKEKAKRAFLTAIGLNNSNRFIVRSVARFFLHIEEPEIGHRILLNAPTLSSDPGILSAEIAFSELLGGKSRWVSRGVHMIEDDNISLKEKNELVGQIATLEFANGKNKKAKRFVEKCLVEPNENILAQLEFISTTHKIDHDFDSNSYSVMCQYEALTRAYFARCEFSRSLENSKLWLNFQPFSHKPAILASYIAATVTHDYEQAIKIAQNALRISPDSTALKNNLSYSFAKNNQIKNAIDIIKSINLNTLKPYEGAVITATIGFILYKNGELARAKDAYSQSIKYFRTTKNEIALARALYNYSTVLKETDPVMSNACIQEALALSKDNNIVEIRYILENDTSLSRP